MIEYASQQDKSLELPFNLNCTLRKKSSDSFDFKSIFKMNQLLDFSSDDKFLPLITDVSVQFFFPYFIKDVSALSVFENLKSQNIDSYHGSIFPKEG